VKEGVLFAKPLSRKGKALAFNMAWRGDQEREEHGENNSSRQKGSAFQEQKSHPGVLKRSVLDICRQEG